MSIKIIHFILFGLVLYSLSDKHDKTKNDNNKGIIKLKSTPQIFGDESSSLPIISFHLSE